MTFSQFYRFLESQDWILGKGGNHYKYYHPSNPRIRIPVGRHPSQEIGPELLDKMLKETGLKDAFRNWKKK